jgi:hypothetical protein
MVKQKGQKVVAAAARAAKDRQVKALQKGMGLLLDKDEDERDEAESALRTPQNAAACRPVLQSLQQCEGGAPGKWAAQMDMDPSSLVLIPMLTPPLNSVCAHSSGPAGQDAKDVKQPVYPPPSASPYIKSPPPGQEAVTRMGI